LERESEERRCVIAHYSDIEASTVDWLWYPYIPFGKLTLLQGDPGEGKTAFALQIASLLSQGKPLPGSTSSTYPIEVIYQSSEDNAADTIKPRLMKAGADCERIAFVSDDDSRLSLIDERLREAIVQTNARLLILDPLQAFIPSDCDMSRASDMRSAMSRLARLAEETDCAILLIGHMNKAGGSKGIYRSIGSIDIPAIARSVLLIGRPDEDSDMRVVAHIKSNLAPAGRCLGFEFTEDGRIEWVELEDEYSARDLLSDAPTSASKQEQAERYLEGILADGARRATEVYQYMQSAGIAKRTVDRAKRERGVRSYRSNGEWYWTLK